jgi:16S rRNA (cytosine1402-N4)-methyltransferase
LKLSEHIPVLLDKVLETFGDVRGRVVIDATFGAGGYSRAFLGRGAKVIAFDRDPSVTPFAEELRKQYGDDFIFINAPFSHISYFVSHVSCPMPHITDIVFDLGISSMQIDTPDRGFSWRFDAPLDMRMSAPSDISHPIGGSGRKATPSDISPPIGGGGRKATPSDISPPIGGSGRKAAPSDISPPIGGEWPRSGRGGGSAAELIEQLSMGQIAEILRDYGDMKNATGLARKIKSALPRTTFQLKDLISNPKDVAPVFQALRIAVNDELGEIERALNEVPALLPSGGICACVTFHSIEDRLVKNIFREWTARVGDPHIPSPVSCEEISNAAKKEGGGDFISLKTFRPDAVEMEKNPRARSSHLRAVRKISNIA